MQTLLLYLYVDGENHFIRAIETWKAMQGPLAELDSVAEPHNPGTFGKNPEPEPGLPRIRVRPEVKFFWDSQLLSRLLNSDRFFRMPSRAVYFTSFTGKPNELHDARVFIRQSGFDPVVIEEPAQLQKQRENLAAQTGTRKSAKGVDIALTVQMLEDASRGNFDSCILVTTDVDFLPVIDAVRRMGKRVTVLGYKSGLGPQSEFEYAPDKFIDIGEAWVRTAYVPISSKIPTPTTRRVGPFLVDSAAKKVSLKLEKEQERSLKKIKDLAGKVATDGSVLQADTSIQADGIAVNAGKLAVLQKAAQELETAAAAFQAADKDLT